MSAVTLHRIDPALNMSRFYQLYLQPDLFGGVLLMKKSGRIGARGRIMAEYYEARTQPAWQFDPERHRQSTDLIFERDPLADQLLAAPHTPISARRSAPPTPTKTSASSPISTAAKSTPYSSTPPPRRQTPSTTSSPTSSARPLPPPELSSCNPRRYWTPRIDLIVS
jgi:predicted DNA-binding WGR domain protein